MMGFATTTVSTYRDTTTDAFGDPSEANAVATLTAIPFSLMEQSRATSRQANDRAQTTRAYTGRCQRGTDIRMGDRVKDEASGAIYLVTNVHVVQSPISMSDLVMDLDRTPTS